MAPADNAVLKHLPHKYTLKLKEPSRATPLLLKLITTIKNNDGLQFKVTTTAHCLVAPSDAESLMLDFTAPDVAEPTEKRPGLKIWKSNDNKTDNSFEINFELIDRNGDTDETRSVLIEIEPQSPDNKKLNRSSNDRRALGLKTIGSLTSTLRTRLI